MSVNIIRHADPDDVEAIHRIPSGPRAIEGTLPLQSVEGVRKRFFSETPLYQLVTWWTRRWSGTWRCSREP